jgi:hypothetical protein
MMPFNHIGLIWKNGTMSGHDPNGNVSIHIDLIHRLIYIASC